MTAMESDERLYERLRGGDLAAFDALYARYERPLFGFIVAHLGDRGEAEDAFHESFLALLRSRAIDFDRGSFRSWIYRVARNECLNRLRSRERGSRALVAVAVAPIAPPAPAADERIADGETAHALGAAVERLPAALAEVYRLRIAGLSYEEMARVLELPLGTVKSRMHDMVAKLRKEMDPWTAK